MNPVFSATFLPVATLLLEGLTAEAPLETGIPDRPVVLAESSAPHIAYGPSPWYTANEPHRSFLTGASQGLETSLFDQSVRTSIGGALDSARFGLIPAGRAADYLWQMLAMDFFARLPGASSRYDARNRVAEFRCPAKSLKGDVIFFPDRLQAIGKFLDLPYSLYEESEDEAIMRIPTLRFLEARANRLGLETPFGGGGSAEWSYALAELLRDDFNREHLEGRQAIALPLNPIFLSHANGMVHPFIFAKHDVYHAVLVAMMPIPLRRMAAGLYEAIRGLPDELRELPFVDPMMDFLSDKEIPRGRVGDLLEGAFLFLREDIRSKRVSPSARRFLREAQAAWEPYLHESVRGGIVSYFNGLENLLP